MLVSRWLRNAPRVSRVGRIVPPVSGCGLIAGREMCRGCFWGVMRVACGLDAGVMQADFGLKNAPLVPCHGRFAENL